MKIQQRPYPVLYPVPVVLVSSLDADGAANISTMAWVGTVASAPPQVAVAIRPHRYCYESIKERGEFVVNIPSEAQLAAVDYCGSVSKTEADKLQATGLTTTAAVEVQPPLIVECPVNLECRVRQVISLGSHDLFIAEIAVVHVDDSLLDDEGFIDFTKARPIAYLGNEYWSVGQRLQRAAFTLGRTIV